MQIDQRGAKQKCSGTAGNLLLDNVVLRDVKLHQRNLSVAWIDVRKAYDSVNHGWIRKILEVHRLPDKLTAAIRNIIHNWNVIVLIPTINGTEKSPVINSSRITSRRFHLWMSVYNVNKSNCLEAENT